MDPGGAVPPEEHEVLVAFHEYYSAFMEGVTEDLSTCVSLPFFDIRDGEITRIGSEAQLVGFRRGLLARMTTSGVVSPALASTQVLMADAEIALVQFESAFRTPAGLTRGGAKSVAFMRRDGRAGWRAWMISVLSVYESESEAIHERE